VNRIEKIPIRIKNESHSMNLVLTFCSMRLGKSMRMMKGVFLVVLYQ